MSLPPAVQMHVEQILQLLALQSVRPESIEIHFDRDGVVQTIKPRLSFQRGKQADRRCGG